LIRAVFAGRTDAGVAAGLLIAIISWGANNVAVKYLLGHWPPMFTAASRMLFVAVIMFALLRWTRWLGAAASLTPELRRGLRFRAGAILAVYIVAYTYAVKLTSPAHVAVYFATAPVWSLFLEGRPAASWASARRVGAALLALAGVVVLFWPKLMAAHQDWRGDALALAGSLIWIAYSRECQRLGAALNGTQITAHAMWHACLWLAPLALWEFATQAVPWNAGLLGAQAFSIVFSGILAFCLYTHALHVWPVSRVFLFGNLIPLATMGWAWLLLGDPVTGTFWAAMALVAAGVALGQMPQAKGKDACPPPGE
jgi:drug/metabolite transporter (DMT)-like permease